MVEEEFEVDSDRTYPKKCENLLKEINEGVYIHDLEGDFHDINKAGLEILGYEREEFLSLNVKDILTEESFDEWEKIKKLAESQEKFSGLREVKIKGKDGSNIWVEFKASFIESQDKTYVQGIFRDITARKKSERALNGLVYTITGYTGQQLFRLVLDQVMDWFELDGAFLGKLSDNKEKVLPLAKKNMALDGYRLDKEVTPCKEALNKGFSLYQKDVQKEFPDDEKLKSLNAEGYIGFTIKDKDRKPQGIIWGFSRSKIDDFPSNWDYLMEIVSSRIFTEMERMEKEEELHNIREAVQNSGDSVYIFDKDFRYIFANEEHLTRLYQAGKISHKSEEKLLGKKFSDIQSEKGQEILKEALKRVSKENETLQQEHELPRSGRWTSRTYTPVKNKNTGELEAIIVISKDITERKKIEKELELHLKEKENIIKRLSHDLKTPIGPMVNLLPLIKEKVQQKYQDEKLINDLEVCQENAIYLKDLLDHILKIVKFPKRAIKPKRTNLYDFIANWKKGFEKRHKKKIRSEKEVKILNKIKEDIHLNIDRMSFSEVLDNLVMNSINNIPEKGKITLRSKEEEDNIKIIIEDTGTGIDEDELEDIFDYFRQKAPAEYDLDSIGLGLPISKYIIENHDGDIWAENRDEEGARFYIKLPKIEGD